MTRRLLNRELKNFPQNISITAEALPNTNSIYGRLLSPSPSTPTPRAEVGSPAPPVAHFGTKITYVYPSPSRPSLSSVCATPQCRPPVPRHPSLPDSLIPGSPAVPRGSRFNQPLPPCVRVMYVCMCVRASQTHEWGKSHYETIKTRLHPSLTCCQDDILA